MSALPSVGRRGTAFAASAVVVLLAVGLPLLLTTPARGVDYTLYGDAGTGWGLTQTSISSPGPMLIVTQGQMVHLTLFSADTATHTWCIDYNADHACAATGENESAAFSSMVTPVFHMFIPTGTPGAYTYMCGFHGDLIMKGVIRIIAPVAPVVSISSPAGSQRWTGGSPHPIVWTMTDPNDPVTSLRAWVNYSTGGPWNPIAGPIIGSTNPHSSLWSVPLVNTTTASVNVTVVDPSGNRAWAVQPVNSIDSRAPAVVGQVPPNGSTGISTATNVIVTFDEAMNQSATGAPVTAGIQDILASTWIPVTYAWNAGGDILTIDPVANLAPTTQYSARVNISAKDASDPGNGLGAPASWLFTTGAGADLVKPQIANVAVNPPIQEYASATLVSATITDNDVVASAFVTGTSPDASPFNHSMAPGSGNSWVSSVAYPQLGDYVFAIEAVDPSGNWNRSAQGSFRVDDTTPPTIGSVTAVPSPAEVYLPATISALVADPFLLPPVAIVLDGTNYTMTLNTTTARYERTFTPDQVRAYTFTIWAIDGSGNPASHVGAVDVQDTIPPQMPTGLVATVLGGTAIELRWSAVPAPDLAGYKLYRSQSASGPFTTQVGPSTITGTAYVDAGLQAGTTYYYVVSAVDTRAHESMKSPSVSGTIPAPAVDTGPVIIAGVALGAIIASLAVALLLLRRRRQKKGA